MTKYSDGRHRYTNKLRADGVQQWPTRLSMTNNEHICNNLITAYNADSCTIEINQIKCCARSTIAIQTAAK